MINTEVPQDIMDRIDETFPDREFLGVADISQYLEVPERTVRGLIARKELLAIKIGREFRIPVNRFKRYMVESATSHEPETD